MRLSTRLRAMLNEPEIIVLPGAYDALTAKLAERAGFNACFTTGFGFAATVLGVPDYGLLTMSETMDRVRHIVRAISVPLVADMDTGYGNPLNVVRTVRECVALGVAGIILEDQEWPKKCGHFEGKRVIPAEEQAAKLRAAADARGGADLGSIGRADAPRRRAAGSGARHPGGAAFRQHDRGRQDAAPQLRGAAGAGLQDGGLPALRALLGDEGGRGNVPRAVRSEDNSLAPGRDGLARRVRGDHRRAPVAGAGAPLRGGVVGASGCSPWATGWLPLPQPPFEVCQLALQLALAHGDGEVAA